MNSNKFHGVVPAMATPFDQDERLDAGLLHALVDWYLDCGVHGISIAGSQGEFFALDESEHIAMVERLLERTPDPRVDWESVYEPR